MQPLRYLRYLGALCAATAVTMLGLPAAADGQAPVDVSFLEVVDQGEAMEMLRRDLVALGRRMQKAYAATTAQIKARAADARTRSNAKAWGSTMGRMTAQAVNNKNPVAGLLDLWALCAQDMQFLTGADGAGWFDDAIPVAVAVAKRMLAEVESLATEYVPAEQLGELRVAVENHASTHPLLPKKSWFARWFNWKSGFFTMLDGGRRVADTLSSVPLMPKRTVQGVQRTARGIGDLSETAARFTDVVEALPQRTREELELLATRLDAQAATASRLLADVRAASESVGRTVAQAGALTENVTRTVDAAGVSAAAIERAANSIGQAADSGARLAETASALTDELDRRKHGAAASDDAAAFDIRDYTTAADAIGAAADEVRTMLEEIRRLTQREAKTTPADADATDGGFDVRDYRDAALAIQGGAREIRQVLAEVRNGVEDGSMNQAAGQLAAHATTAAAPVERLVNLAALRIAQLMFLALVLALVYAAARRKIGSNRQ